MIAAVASYTLLSVAAIVVIGTGIRVVQVARRAFDEAAGVIFGR